MIRSSIPLVRLPLENVKNCRDLGGYPTPYGSTRWGRFLRCGDMGQMSEAEKDYLFDFGVRTVLDLRTPEECEVSPNPIQTDPRFCYLAFDLIPRSQPSEHFMKSDLSKLTLGELYIRILDAKERVGAVLDLIAAHDEGALLFHCTAGKDRTGVIAMLLLGLSEVSTEDILANYQISFTHLDTSIDVLKRVPMNLLDSKPEYLIHALDHLYTNYGGFPAYFTACGFTTAKQATLRLRIVEQHKH
ncbi:MAG: tyrosine-protein phosphatase [Erysipelotrichales bacterium]|nr:MAG: tyrosine-protein phosphatase [Erysipelotrichales bacterium]